jgi:hypothetical protein
MKYSLLEFNGIKIAMRNDFDDFPDVIPEN